MTELCWLGSPLPDRSRVMTQTKKGILQVGDRRGPNDPTPQTQPNVKKPKRKQMDLPKCNRRCKDIMSWL